MRADGADEDSIAAIRMTPQQKLQRLNEFAAKNKAAGYSKIVEEISINSGTMQVDTGALLTGDSNEELRMQDRLIEKAENAKTGKMPRVTPADLQQKP